MLFNYNKLSFYIFLSHKNIISISNLTIYIQIHIYFPHLKWSSDPIILSILTIFQIRDGQNGLDYSLLFVDIWKTYEKWRMLSIEGSDVSVKIVFLYKVTRWREFKIWNLKFCGTNEILKNFRGKDKILSLKRPPIRISYFHQSPHFFLALLPSFESDTWPAPSISLSPRLPELSLSLLSIVIHGSTMFELLPSPASYTRRPSEVASCRNKEPQQPHADVSSMAVEHMSMETRNFPVLFLAIWLLDHQDLATNHLSSSSSTRPYQYR